MRVGDHDRSLTQLERKKPRKEISKKIKSVEIAGSTPLAHEQG